MSDKPKQSKSNKRPIAHVDTPAPRRSARRRSITTMSPLPIHQLLNTGTAEPDTKASNPTRVSFKSEEQLTSNKLSSTAANSLSSKAPLNANHTVSVKKPLEKKMAGKNISRKIKKESSSIKKESSSIKKESSSIKKETSSIKKEASSMKKETSSSKAKGTSKSNSTATSKSTSTSSSKSTTATSLPKSPATVPGVYEQKAGIDPETSLFPLCGLHPNGDGWHGAAPTRHKSTNALLFKDFPDFTPNLTPQQVLSFGSFGGGYFRNIKSGVTGAAHTRVWRELPKEWLEDIDIKTKVSSPKYQVNVNKYKKNCGAKVDKSDTFGLLYWEKSGWINQQDPYGWFHWYCRFFQGRRSDDDGRQVSRWSKAAGPRGRWKQNLIGKCMQQGKSFDDETVSPVVRQTLQHWGYALTKEDYTKGAKRVQTHGASYIKKTELAHVMKKKTPTKKEEEEE